METTEYDSFTETCIEELKILQEKLRKEFNLDWFENWYYDHLTELLTFSTGDKQLNFKYVDIGSFSTQSNTWKWAWDNEYTPDNVKEKANIVREFGRKKGFTKLIVGYFTSNEIEAWEFSAISVKLINGIGVYRPVNDLQLQTYLVLTEFVDNETAQSIKDQFVKCDIHVSRRRAFVCQHINRKTKVGFEEAFDTFEDMELDDEEDFQAWCSECEIVRQKEGEWNDNSMEFTKIKVICEGCYFDMKELNLGKR